MQRRRRQAKTTPEAPSPHEQATSTAETPRRWAIPVVAVLSLALLGGGWVFADWWSCVPEDIQPTYVGRQSCVECHADYCHQWQGSHHDLAMDLATPETVLADFDDAEFEHHGIVSRMFRRGAEYWIHTEGPDGEMTDFQVKYVFGYDPLQQYMVEFGRTDEMPEDEVPRVQVLRISWDTNRGKWFYLPPPDVRDKLDPEDELHWTGIAQRWNNMCADCHSTNLQKNYDVASGTYHTTYSEIDVSCEACHGPASLHVELARGNSLFWDRKRGFGLARLKDDPQQQIESCAPCHSRRRCVDPGYRAGDAYYDHWDNELLMRATYHSDGQILDEDYVYGSFIQSRMYHQGIRCTDCHDPHTARLKQDSNQVCTSCHQHPAGKYDGPAHHHHQPGSTGALCVECHMPETTYMEVDPRRDHSIRNPRPDLSVDLGTPNACTRCHIDKQEAGLTDRDDLGQYLDWILAARNGDESVAEYLGTVDRAMADACGEWYGDKRADDRLPGKHFAYAIDAARRGEPAAEPELIRLATDGRVPALVRATALMELNQYDSTRVVDTCRQLLRDPNPQVRATAVGNLQGRMAPDDLVRALGPLLEDPVRLVRTEVARVLVGVDRRLVPGAQREQLEQALEEFERGVLSSNDRAGSHLGLGYLYASLGQLDRALEAYETAIRVEPRVSGPRSNLAELCDQLAESSDRRAEQARQLGNAVRATQAADEAAEYRDRARQLRREELDNLERDASLLPESPDVQHRYGMLLYLHRRMDEAERALAEAHRLEPNNPRFLMGLVLFYKELGQREKAIPLARELLGLRPRDATYQAILRDVLAMPETE